MHYDNVTTHNGVNDYYYMIGLGSVHMMLVISLCMCTSIECNPRYMLYVEQILNRKPPRLQKRRNLIYEMKWKPGSGMKFNKSTTITISSCIFK